MQFPLYVASDIILFFSCRRYLRCCDFGNKENSKKIIGSVYTNNVYCER